MAVSREDLATAVDWLRCNEGADGEAMACMKVADFLQAEIDRRDVRSIARETGLPMARARATFRRCA